MQLDIAVSQHNIHLHFITQIGYSTLKKNRMNKNGRHLSAFSSNSTAFYVSVLNLLHTFHLPMGPKNAH